MTLIEVLTSLAILGTVLVGLVMAKARHTRQISLASHRIEACAIADQLLESWWASSEGVPRDTSGSIEGKPEWSWQTQSLHAPPLIKSAPSIYEPGVDEHGISLQLEVVRLEILGPNPDPLASVELLVRSNLETGTDRMSGISKP